MPATPTYITVRGVAGASTVSDSPEIWQFGTWWRTVSETIFEFDQEGADSIATLAAESAVTMFTDTNAKFSSNIHITEARCYVYPDLGAPALVVGVSDPDTAPQAGTADDFRPLENSLAITLGTTGRAKPRSGRFYLPPQAYTLDNTSRIQAADAGHCLDAVGDFLGRVDSALADISHEDWRLVVQSRRAPYLHKPVTELRCGHVVDTQRRRRNRQDEAYTVRSYG